MKDARKALRPGEIRGTVRYDEPMAYHTTFRVGGSADVYVIPSRIDDLSSTLAAAADSTTPVFILGGGANILVSDRGIRGIVIDLRRFDYCTVQGSHVVAGAGTPMSEVTEVAARSGLAGLEFIHAMPGSVGGSVWMNARCYGESVSDRLVAVELVGFDGTITSPPIGPADFGYKRSPFQSMRAVIVEARFALERGDPVRIRHTMEAHRLDREAKGHFAYPSVGSIFKNNHAFGAPTGKLLDGLGLRGFTVGGAKISDVHANIVVNSGGATAGDIFSVIEHAERRAREELGLALEREVILIGEWPGDEVKYVG